MCTTVKKVVKYLAGIMLLFAFYIAFLMLGRAIPKDWVVENVEKSYYEIKNEGLYFSTGSDALSYDNWTTSYYLSSAVTERDGSLLEQALANSYTRGHGESVIDNISAAIDGTGKIASYSRYWAGNTALYKILLIFFSVGEIRSILFTVTIFAFVFLIIKSYFFVGKRGIFAFVIAIVIPMLLPKSLCLTYWSDIFLLFCGMIGVCWLQEHKSSTENYVIFFMALGSIDAYVGYWAFPILVCGFPLVLLTYIRLQKGEFSRNVIIDNLVLSVAWGGISWNYIGKADIVPTVFRVAGRFVGNSTEDGSGYGCDEPVPKLLECYY